MGIVTTTSETAFNHPPEVVYDFVTNPANWTKTYPGSAHVGDLPDRLLAEIEGIAVWALAGYQRVRQNGKFSAVECDLMTRFRRASASIDSFLRERCVVHESIGPLHLDLQTTPDKIEVARQDLFGHYVSYCEKYNVYPRAEKSFHADLTELIPTLPTLSYRTHGQPWRYRGIKVREGFNE